MVLLPSVFFINVPARNRTGHVIKWLRDQSPILGLVGLTEGDLVRVVCSRLLEVREDQFACRDVVIIISIPCKRVVFILTGCEKTLHRPQFPVQSSARHVDCHVTITWRVDW